MGDESGLRELHNLGRLAAELDHLLEQHAQAALELHEPSGL